MSKEEQIKRLSKKDGIEESEASQILISQLRIDEKKDLVLNTGNLRRYRKNG
ncbi:MAG: 50S ribosomal protein L29 [Desulfobacterales bacterium]|nr:50S ribosomal protein L29 [Desulfobacterales bacterium]